MAKLTKQCFGCKQQFLKTELVNYASLRATQLHSYCPKCLEEKKIKDNFVDAVCQIFNLKAPGPRIWTERKRIIDTYGYTDQTIIDCLQYLYNEKKLKKLSESLCLVTPKNVEDMMKYKRQKSFEATKLSMAFVQSLTSETKPRRVRLKDTTQKKLDDNWNPDDFFKD